MVKLQPYHLVEVETGRVYDAETPRWCGESGALLDLAFTPRLNVAALARRKPELWRYRECLPIQNDESIVSLGEGCTPLLPVRLGGHQVWIKQEQLFSTGSFKDRGAAVLISKVKEWAVQRVVQDSSGNAGCAIAAYCARAGLACEIFVPENTSAQKIEQIRAYGAGIRLIRGDREATARAARQAAESIYYASHCWNPFFLHGTKTFAYEVWEQLQRRAPDDVVLPAGNGTLLLGAFIGFCELLEQGLISRLPEIHAVQTARCAPLYEAFRRGMLHPVPVAAEDTAAEGIAIAKPVRGSQILAAVRQTRGRVIAINEEEIEKSRRDMARQGFYIEPTAAVAVAGAVQILNGQPPGRTLVTALTGHGLKHSYTG
ncbi:pyridoxal-phosphate dependent enzyme [bacterium]|nr:pyridoxal-phosphate dependent enzyme [bacterium]